MGFSDPFEGFVKSPSSLSQTLLLLIIAVLWHFGPINAQEIDPRLEQAIQWYTGVAGKVDNARAKDLLLKAVEEEDVISKMWLARCYSRGRMGFEEDREKAQEIARLLSEEIMSLAEKGLLEAIFLMGTVRDEGLGKEEDPSKAAEWFRKAGERGHVLAQHNLGNAYFSGRGLEQNDSLAVHWWFKAANKGDTIAQYRLGLMYEEGRGVEQDLAEAKRWYNRALIRGEQRARDALKRLEGKN